jgi:ribosomal protein S18 acetylase RimI-like enzyme
MVVIRPMTDADVDEVAAVRVRSWQSAYAGIVPADYLAAMDPAELAKRRRGQAKKPGQQAVVAEANERIVGLANFGPYRHEDGNPRAGELYAIYVDPGHWSEGAGWALFSTARDALRREGFPDMRLWVLTGNHRARRFYERAGMRPDGVTHFWAPPGTTAELPELRYTLDL